MQTPTTNVSQATCILSNHQDNTTTWRCVLQMEEITLPKGGLSCPKNSSSVVNEPMYENNTCPLRERGKGDLEMIDKEGRGDLRESSFTILVA